MSLEVTDRAYRFHFPVPGFSIDYHGPLKAYHNWIEVSPSGYRIYRRKDTLWGVFYDKETFAAELLDIARKAGAEIRPETIGLSAENTADGVRVRGRTGEEMLEAKKVIAADGRESNIVDSLGLNQKRQQLTPPRRGAGLVGYELEGVRTDLPPGCFLSACVPSINRLLIIYLGQMGGDKTILIGGAEEIVKFMKHPVYSPWFQDARLAKRWATAAGGSKYGLLGPIKEPGTGNVVIIGDAAAPIET